MKNKIAMTPHQKKWAHDVSRQPTARWRLTVSCHTRQILSRNSWHTWRQWRHTTNIVGTSATNSWQKTINKKINHSFPTVVTPDSPVKVGTPDSPATVDTPDVRWQQKVDENINHWMSHPTVGKPNSSLSSSSSCPDTTPLLLHYHAPFVIHNMNTTLLSQKIKFRPLQSAHLTPNFTHNTWSHLATKKSMKKINHRILHQTVGTPDSSSSSSCPEVTLLYSTITFLLSSTRTWTLHSCPRTSNFTPHLAHLTPDFACDSWHTWRHLETKELMRNINHRILHSTVGTPDSSSSTSFPEVTLLLLTYFKLTIYEYINWRGCFKMYKNK